MQKTPPKFDLLVLGNEPAGLWLLREFTQLYPHSLTEQKLPITTPELGWLRLNKKIPSVLMSKPIAHHFGIEPHDFFSVEIASRDRLFRWSPEKVLSFFSDLPDSLTERFLQSLAGPSGKERKAISLALIRQPDLLTYAQSLWKQIGRSRKVTPEMTIWAALQSLELFHFNPEGLVSSLSHLQTYSLSEQQEWVSIEQTPEKLFKITLSSGPCLFTKSLVLNLTVNELLNLSAKNPLLDWSQISKNILSRYFHYPLTLELENYRLPHNIQPVTIILDEEVLPEPDTEMWPLTLSSHLTGQAVTIWVTHRANFSYEGLTEALGKALGRFQHHFPEALKNLKHISIPLGVESCHGDEQRQSIIKQIEIDAKELYGVSLLHVQTRKKGLYSLLPALRCDLPYPLGTLQGAQEILKECFNKKTLKKHLVVAEEMTHNS